uniref:Testis specific 10 n=1 Tax=Amazona collaria TaxID=241587 RepID=A0A8B9EYI7_9PSIT
MKQGRSPSKLDAFIKTLEEDRDYYKNETENLRKTFRNTFASPKRTNTYDILKILREREDLKSTQKRYERHIAEIQGNLNVLTAERDKMVNLYEQAQQEISRLRQEVIKCPGSPKATVTAQAMLRQVERERDTVLSDFRRMTTERDSLREQLKISQETVFNEKARLEQRIEELEATIQNLESERLEQVSKATLMKDTIDSLETEIKRLARKALDSKAELSQREAEYVSLNLLNEKTEQSLSEAQQSLVKKKYELQVAQEKITLLDEKIGNFSRQSLVQQEEICALKGTVVQLNKEKASLQGCVEEGRKKIAAFEESLATKEKIISDFKILISELEHSIKKSSEALCICEKDITTLDQQLQETTKELAQANKNRESLAQENDRLQVHLSSIKQENQVLYKKLAKYQNELDDTKLKAQDLNTDIVRLKDVLRSKERENCELLENYHKVREQEQSWEAKCHQAEADCSSVRLVLISAESENCRLKEKLESLERVMDLFFTKPTKLVSDRQFLKTHKCESSYSEIELLRKQLGNERAAMKNLESLLVSSREKELQAQMAKQEKDSTIQLLKEQLSAAEDKLAVQSRDFTQLRNRAAQLELELDMTKRQLGTERTERQVYVLV